MKSEKYILLIKKFHAITSVEFAKTIEDVTCWYNNIEVLNDSEKVVDNSILMNRFQYLDTFEQKIIHIIYAHSKVKRLQIDNHLKKPFLLLQYFQFSVIAHDLFDSISTIEAELGLERQPIISVFTRKPELVKLTEEIKKSIKEQCGEIKFIPPITEEQIQICMQLYTMESERIVLNWFLNNMPEGQWSDLLELYQSLHKGKSSKSIELF